MRGVKAKNVYFLFTGYRILERKTLKRVALNSLKGRVDENEISDEVVERISFYVSFHVHSTVHARIALFRKIVKPRPSRTRMFPAKFPTAKLRFVLFSAS